MLERVQKGQRIRAAHHNEIVGALESLRNIHGTGGLQVSNNPQGTSVTRAETLTLKGGALQCAALNADTKTLQAYQPVVITGQMYDTANDPNLYAPPVLRVRRRDADDDADLPVAVVSDSMQTNTIGRVYTVGVCLCYLTGDDAVRASYDTVDGTALTLTSEGSIEVLWCNDDSAKPGLIRLGGGGGGGGTSGSSCWIEVSSKEELAAVPITDSLLFAFVSSNDAYGHAIGGGNIPSVYALVRDRSEYQVLGNKWICITHTQAVE